MRIELKTSDVKSSFEKITGTTKKPNMGQSYQIKEGVSLSYLSGYDNEFSVSEVLLFIAVQLNAVGISLLSCHLYDKLKNDKDTKLLINDKEVSIDPKLIEEFMLFVLQKEKEEKEQKNTEDYES